MEVNVSESVKLSYTIHDYSCYSSNYTPENILVNKPSIPLSRWFTDSVAPSHFVTLKLQSTSIVETITFGKYIKAHASDLKKFHVYGGMHEKDLKLLLSAGLKNNNKTEKFSLLYKTSEGFNLPVNYIKIVPLQSWGAANNFSIWYVELHGKNQPEIIADSDFNYRLRVEESDVRCILSFLRRRRYAGAYEALARETGASMGCGAALRLWDALVEREDYDEAEAIVQQAADDGEFELHLRSSRAAASWELLTPLSPEVDAALACSAPDEQPPAPADPDDALQPDAYEQIETTLLDVLYTEEPPVVGIDLAAVESTSSTSQCSLDLSFDCDSAVHTEKSAACTRSLATGIGTKEDVLSNTTTNSKEDLVINTLTSTKEAAVVKSLTGTKVDAVATAETGIETGIAATAEAKTATKAEVIVDTNKHEATTANVKNEETIVPTKVVSVETQEVISTNANKLVIVDAEKSDKGILVDASSTPAVSVEPVASAAPQDNAEPKHNAESTDNLAPGDDAEPKDNAVSTDNTTPADNAELKDNAVSTDNTAPADNAEPKDNAVSTDNTAPADNAVSTDNTTPADNAEPKDNAVSTDNTAPADNAVSTDNTTPADNAEPKDNAVSTDNTTPADNTTPSSPESLMRLEEHPTECNGEENMRPRARGGHQLVADTSTGALYLFGGWDGREDLDDLWRFSPRARRWALLSAHCARAGGPSPRSCHKMVFDSARRCIYLLGRFVESGCRNRDTLRSELYKYDVGSGRWSVPCADTAAAGGPRQVFDHQLCIDPRLQLLFVFGGRVLPGADHRADSPEQESSQPKYSGLYAYYIASGRWQCMLPDEHRLAAPQPRVSHNMLYHPGERRLYIFGGQRQKRPLLDMWAVDVVSGRCAALRPPGPRRPAPAAGCTQRAALDPCADRIYVLTGMNKDREARVCNELWVLDLRTQRWAREYRSGGGAGAAGAADEPLPRFAHQFVYDHVAETHYLFGGNPGCAGGAGGAGGAGARLRLDDMWALRVRFPAAGALVRRLRRALRELRYRALLADRRPCDALVYLRDRLRPLVDTADRRESLYYKELSSLLLRGLSLPPPPARLAPRPPHAATYWKESEWQACGVREPRPQSPAPDGGAGGGPGCACDASGRREPEAGRARVLRLQVYDQLCEYFAPHRRPKRDVSNIGACSSHEVIDAYF